MGLLKKFKSKSRLRDPGPARPTSYETNYPILSQQPRHNQPDLTARLPDRVLARIFTFVCPHTRDTTYLPSEESQIGDGCMLCDLRDLARCSLVCRKWYSLAQGLLYRSIRIDAVHYCALEDELAERRKKAAKFRTRSAVEPVDIPHIRLQLLARSVRENASIAEQVQILKLPYMTRETAKGDLARTVSALPSLQYVDLPDGFYSGDPACLALRQELQVRCPDIRKMTYRAGAEEALELLAQRHWQRMEVLELDSLAVEPATLRIVLASLPALRELTLTNMQWFDDSVFQQSNQLPDFPPLHALTLVNMPQVTAQGLIAYLQAPNSRETLSSLTLRGTAVTVKDLPSVLWAASSLQHLSITEIVIKSLGLNTQELPPLTSISLKVLHFEITSSDEVHGLQKPSESYYSYLASSLHRNALPALETLYVRDENFPDLLLMPPLPTHARGPSTSTTGSSNGNGLGTRLAPTDTGSLKSKASNLSAVNTNTSNNLLAPPTPTNAPRNGSQPSTPQGFAQKLEVFTKGSDDIEWLFTEISPPSSTAGYRGSFSLGRDGARRPSSTYSASKGLGPQWAQTGFGSDARRSVVVGDGLGGFLALPQEGNGNGTDAMGMSLGGRPVSEGYLGGPRWGSVGTQSSATSSFLKPPPSLASVSSAEKRHSKHDLWR